MSDTHPLIDQLRSAIYNVNVSAIIVATENSSKAADKLAADEDTLNSILEKMAAYLPK